MQLEHHPILVTGAAGGKQGGTGRKLVSLLREYGLPVRAFVHSEDDRSDQLKAIGAEVFVGDMLNIDSVRAAARGVRRAYFAYPVQPGLLDATAIFSTVAKDADFEIVVNNSHLNASEDAPSPRTRQHWLSEQVFNWVDIGTTHLRAALFMENIRRNAAENVALRGELRMPLGNPENLIPLIAGEDVARVAAMCLVNPEKFAGQTLFIMAEALSVAQLAQTLSSKLDKPVKYVPISDNEWRGEAEVREGPKTEFEIEHLSKLWWTLSNLDPKQIIGDLQQPHKLLTNLIERQPLSFASFVEQNASIFKGGISA